MTVLTNFPAIPNRIAIACEYLQDAGASGVSRDQFDAHLSPGPAGGDEEDRSGKSMARHVLDEVAALELAVAAETGVRLSPALPTRAMTYGQWLEWLKPYVCDRLTDPVRAVTCRQAGVPLALAWLLCQDPRRPVRWSGAHAALLQAQFGDVDALGFNLRNDQIFQNLVYWARYLGLAETIGLRGTTGPVLHVIPDPTRAIRRVLPKVFHDTRELPVSAFVERMAAALPVLEEGSARLEVEGLFVGAPQRATRHFSGATGLSLRRLAHEGVLQLLVESDVERWVYEDGRDAKTVSRVSWQGEAA
jgi:hypothetical protein